MSVLIPSDIGNSVDEAIRREINVSTLDEQDTSFALIAVRCNSAQSVGKRKLVPGQVYYLLDGYSIDGTAAISAMRGELNHLYDDYVMEDSTKRPHIQISAIVGRNGSGKSSLIEFAMRLINNFAAITFGELKTGPASERLHYINGVNGDLWFVADYYLHRLHIENGYVELSVSGDVRVAYRNLEISVLFKAGDPSRNPSNRLLSKNDDLALRKIYDSFFYTLISNYSSYAYNTNDFRAESDTDEKERLISAAMPGERFDNERRNWLHGLFHKNDGYQTPMVITPFRYEGNIDINKENDLANERLITLLIRNERLRVINNHLVIDDLTIYGDKGYDYGFRFLKRELGLSNLTLKGYYLLREDITKLWGAQVNKDLRKFKGKPFYELAINYLTYKTLKVSLYYRQHSRPFRLISSMTDMYNPGLIEEMVNSESADLSHITRKIHQTLGYLLYEVYSLELSEGSRSNESFNLDFNRINRLWVKNVLSELTKTDTNSLRSPFQVSIARQAIIPPPFLKSGINLHEKSGQSPRIGFETLSSGEKQQAYAVSSILYHLDNLNSVRDDNSAPLRIPYKNILLVLEEIELYFHPELQQEFLKHLLDGIKQIDLDNIRNIHILLVTHSPYVLSDIPKENVLALAEDGLPAEKRLKTFCANIHEMLKDSFFLSNGSQGEFAKWEVGHILACINIHRLHRKNAVSDSGKVVLPSEDEVYRFLDRYRIIDKDYQSYTFSYDDFCRDFSEQQLRIRIDVIDEPLIRSILKRELNEVFRKTDEELRQARIVELENELRKLREER